MKSDQTILEEAKEKVAQKYGFDDVTDLWRKTGSEMTSKQFDEAALLALKIKGEEMEKEISLFERIELEKQIEQLKSELSQSKSALAASERFRAEDAMSAINEANHLREQLSQAREEKAKAFDNGAEAAHKYLDEFGWIDLTDLVNPYTPKDLTQKK